MVNVKEQSDCGDQKAHKLRVYWAVLDGLSFGGVGWFLMICGVMN